MSPRLARGACILLAIGSLSLGPAGGCGPTKRSPGAGGATPESDASATHALAVDLLATKLVWADGTVTEGAPALLMRDGADRVLLATSSRGLFEGDVPLTEIEARRPGESSGGEVIRSRHAWGPIGVGGDILGVPVYGLTWLFAATDEVGSDVRSVTLDPRDAPAVGDEVWLAIPVRDAAGGHRPVVTKVASIPEDRFVLGGHFVLEAIDAAHPLPEGTPVFSASSNVLAGIVHSRDSDGRVHVTSAAAARTNHLKKADAIHMRDAWHLAAASRAPFDVTKCAPRESEELVGGATWISSAQVEYLAAALVVVGAAEREIQASSALNFLLMIERGRIPDDLFEDLGHLEHPPEGQSIATAIAIILTNHNELLASVCPNPDAVFTAAAARPAEERHAYIGDHCELTLFRSREDYLDAVGYSVVAEMILRAMEEQGAAHPLERELLRKFAGG
jgi:hypothetical protein